jgi:copper homeostasis protein
MPTTVPLEVCAESVASALAAERGGAARVELCANLFEGGTTPSAGLISTARHRISIDLHVMIRPRAGDFCYSTDEFEVMQQDVLIAKQFKANGVVLGLLNGNGTVDIARTRKLVELASPLSVTFHRAFDMSSDLFRALEDVTYTGVKRILTSGGASSAVEGRETLQQLVVAAKGRIIVMAGGGVRDHNVRVLLEHTQVPEVHAGMTESIPSPMPFHNKPFAISSEHTSDSERLAALQNSVGGLVNALRTARPGHNQA